MTPQIVQARCLVGLRGLPHDSAHVRVYDVTLGQGPGALSLIDLATHAGQTPPHLHTHVPCTWHVGNMLRMCMSFSQGPGALSLFDLPTLQRLLAVREGRLVRQLGAAMRAATQVRVSSRVRWVCISVGGGGREKGRAAWCGGWGRQCGQRRRCVCISVWDGGKGEREGHLVRQLRRPCGRRLRWVCIIACGGCVLAWWCV